MGKSRNTLLLMVVVLAVVGCGAAGSRKSSRIVAKGVTGGVVVSGDRHWLLADAPTPSGTPPETVSGQRPLNALPNVLPAKRLAEILTTATAGSAASVSKAEDLPDSGASTVWMDLPSGQQLVVTIQKLVRPIPEAMLTGGSAADTFETWKSGSEGIIINHAQPLVSQVVFVRPSGVMVNVRLLEPRALASKPDLTSSSLADLARSKLDSSSVDF